MTRSIYLESVTTNTLGNMFDQLTYNSTSIILFEAVILPQAKIDLFYSIVLAIINVEFENSFGPFQIAYRRRSG